MTQTSHVIKQNNTKIYSTFLVLKECTCVVHSCHWPYDANIKNIVQSDTFIFMSAFCYFPKLSDLLYYWHVKVQQVNGIKTDLYFEGLMFYQVVT